MILGTTKVVGIFGHPVEHSFSPPMHNACFAQLELDFAYIPLPVAPKDLKAAVAGFRAMNMVGANVTIPHKEYILEHLDVLSPLSEKMGVVNTLYWRDGKLHGTTTDPYGALQNLQQSAAVTLDSQKIMILGYGGAARAIAFALAMDYPSITIGISGRNEAKAQILQNEIVSKTGRNTSFVSSEDYTTQSETWDIVIHTTPIGMHPHTTESPLASEALHPHQIIYDIVYNPRQTQLLQLAQDKGCKTVNGLGMLVYQGAKSFELWTGQTPDTNLMFQTLDNL